MSIRCKTITGNPVSLYDGGGFACGSHRLKYVIPAEVAVDGVVTVLSLAEGAGLIQMFFHKIYQPNNNLFRDRPDEFLISADRKRVTITAKGAAIAQNHEVWMDVTIGQMS